MNYYISLENCHDSQEENNNINVQIKLHGFLENEELQSIHVVDATQSTQKC